MKCISFWSVSIALLLNAALAACCAAELRFAGTVLDEGGKPVAGALVELYRDPALSRATAERQAQQSVTTGPDGRFEFRGVSGSSGYTTLFASKAGLAPAWSSHWNSTTDVADDQLVLSTPMTTAGVVVDEAGKPIANAEVRVTTAYLVKSFEDGRRVFGFIRGLPERAGLVTRTGADGKFQLAGCPANASMDFAVSLPGKTLRVREREYTSPETMDCLAGQQDLKLVLEPAGIVEGKIRAQETGQPLAGARLSLQSDSPGGRRENLETAISGPDGRFRLTQAAPGSYKLETSFGSNELADWVAETVPLVVEAGRTTRDVEVFGTHGGLLAVTVRNKENHQPLSQVSVHAYKKEFQANVETDTNGQACVRLVPGEYQILASQQLARSATRKATVEAGQTNRVDFELNPPPKITGIVRDGAAAPAAGLSVMLLGGFGNTEAQTKTDSAGRFEMNWNPVRSSSSMNRVEAVVVRDPARNLAVAEEVEENTSTLDLRLAPGLTIEGRVEDANGKPITNATARIHIWLGNFGLEFANDLIKADSQGRFAVGGLPADRRYILWVSAKGYGSVNQNIEREGDSTRVEPQPFVLKLADRALAGQVLDADDKPVARASVSLHGDGQPDASVTTDANGRFRFEHVCEGTIQLYARAQRASGNARAEGGDTNVVLRLGVNQPSALARSVPQRVPLTGKPLPDLGPLEFPANCAPAGKPVLLCLVDLEQRPSRRCLRLLAEQYNALRDKGITLLAVQAAVTTPEALKELKASNAVPFPVGSVTDKADSMKWATQAESLPWLILADGSHKVLAEGFPLDELETKLKLLVPGK